MVGVNCQLDRIQNCLGTSAGDYLDYVEVERLAAEDPGLCETEKAR